MLGLMALPSAMVMAESAAEIGRKFDKQKAEALEAYLKANPKAEDATEALELLAHCYADSDQGEQELRVLGLLYDAMPKGADGDLRSAAMNLNRRMSLITDKTAAKAALDAVRKDFAGHEQMAQAEEFFQSLAGKLSLPGVGDTMEIAFTALDGSKVDLAAMKGKVVLVDFWATWCGPCIGELPNVKKAYAAWHEKGFEIVGISLDKEKGTLESFIKKENMTWAQAFDGKGWENELAKKFGIQSIPATFLIGKDGKIAATDLRGPDLEAKVAELLK